MTRKTRSSEYFSESEYGVKASPRVSNKRSGLPRGGGREQLGKPYKVAGKWYYPKEDRRYSKVGAASWYGDAFHGRLTANGEIYDMTHLTAAHPTMPLPSYARVTNTLNGSSVIVRVNDRGPFADGRIIDLSKRAAELLDYAHTGVAKVKVEYVGRAPLDGRDDAFLVASYRPGRTGPDPSDGLPTGVMVAMNGPTPSATVQAASALPGVVSQDVQVARSVGYSAPGGADPVLPSLGPIFPDRPGTESGADEPQQVALGVMSYADQRVKRAASPFHVLGLEKSEVVSRAGPYVLAGTFGSRDDARLVEAALETVGDVDIAVSEDALGTWYSVEVRSDGRAALDQILRAAWDAGMRDAFEVRD